MVPSRIRIDGPDLQLCRHTALRRRVSDDHVRAHDLERGQVAVCHGAIRLVQVEDKPRDEDRRNAGTPTGQHGPETGDTKEENSTARRTWAPMMCS